jgi:hypothetical protein
MASPLHKESNTMSKQASPWASSALQRVLFGFFVVVISFLIVVYLVDPAIYVQVLLGSTSPTDSHPVAATAFLAAILVFVSFLVVGLFRRWRWLFWGLMLAFIAEVIALPIDVLQLAGALPLEYPVWYEAIRLGVSCVQLGIGVWMIWLYRRYGVWAMGSRAGASWREQLFGSA